jgi:multisubunit Na+/H+ antiporter MnhF subunit
VRGEDAGTIGCVIERSVAICLYIVLTGDLRSNRVLGEDAGTIGLRHRERSVAICLYIVLTGDLRSNRVLGEDAGTIVLESSFPLTNPKLICDTLKYPLCSHL